tara:strand:- start:149 stop:739 length:591 start_codon:yes stop_codon:yes gene_type:complete
MIPLHPKIVHFPVALLISAGILGILALIWKSKRDILKEVLLWNLTLGVAGAILALITGLVEEKTLVHNDSIHSIMETHELLGFIFSGIFLAVLIWLFIRKSKMKTTEFSVLVIILVFSSGLLGYSAHLGGKMVYEQGAGVVPMEEIISHGEHQHQHGSEQTDHQDEGTGNDALEARPEQHDHTTHEHDEPDQNHKH